MEGIDQLSLGHQLARAQVNQQLLLKMEAESSLLQLPRRPYNQPVYFEQRQGKRCITNYYPVNLGQKVSHIYQFTFDTMLPIPADSKELLKEVMFTLKPKLKEKIQLATYSGHMLWGLKQLSMPWTVNTNFNYDSKDYSFEVIIKPTKTLSVNDLINNPDGQKMVNQIFNNKIKQILKEKQMEQLTRGKYFDKKEIMVKNVGLSIIRGFKFTLCSLKSGLHLQVDVCSRVFRTNNLLEELFSKKSKDYADSLAGSTIITNYGKRRTYKIVKICHDMNPLSKFWHDKRAGQVTFAQYYEEAYGLKVSQKNQPLIQVILRTEKKMEKGGEMVKKDIVGYLLPEFVSLTGMSDEQRADYKTMKEIAPFTKLKAHERMDETNDIVNVFNNSRQLELGNPRRVESYQLYQPYARLFNDQVLKNHNDGNMVVKDKLKNPVHFKDWVVVYSLGKNPKFDDKDADELVSVMSKAGATFGLKFQEPGFITCDPNVNSWKAEIKKDFEKNGKPQIILLFLNQNEEKFYGELKRYITCQLKVPCQAVRRRTIGKSKNPMSAASKIDVQMNQKIGGTAWEIIQDEQAYTVKKKTMYGAIAISKGKKGFTLAFTGTLDQNMTRVFNYCKTGFKNKENIPQAEYEAIFVTWARNYVAVNKSGPELIMVYRQGLSIQQTERQVKEQLNALENVVKKIGEKTKKPNYNPEIIYTIVTTKINTRIFDLPEGSSQTHSNKFQPRAENPRSGTLVLDELSVDQHYDFHLAAQRVTEGTCTPTHYTIVHNSSKISQQDLTQFTYEQCFNYYNWTGAVKVPAALQCANKLAKLVGESIQQDVTTGEVLTSYYFL